MGTANLEYLRENGPSTAEDLPARIRRYNRDEGLTKFTIRGSDATKMGGPVRAVYYLPEHEKTEVLHAFLEANPGFIEAKSRREFHKLVDSDWTEAAREVSDEFFEIETPEAEYGGVEKQECPMCGEEIERQLPAHLANECSGK